MGIPKVSVIIPNYNHGAYLRQRIDTVLNQTYKDFEVIILDDCSTDHSKEIITNYADHPFIARVIFNDVNSGNPFKQWQRGIEIARGEWIWIAESDDYADERFLELMISAIPPQNNVGLLYCDSKIVSSNNVQEDTFATLKNKRFGTIKWNASYRNTGTNEIESYLLPGGTINNTSAVLFNKNALLDANPFDVSFRYIGDKYAFIKVLAKKDVVYLKDPLNYYRDPFNTKYEDKFVFYFYEQFLVFDWVYKNMEISNLEMFLEGFHSNTNNSLFRDWNAIKFSLYRKLFRLNAKLFFYCVWHNFFQSIRSLLLRIK